VARYAKVDVRIWDDDKVKAMTPIPPCGQGLWIRLLVSRHRTSLPGLLCVGRAALAEEMDWSVEQFDKAFAEIELKGLAKADWKSRVIWVPNAICFNEPENPHVVASWRTWIDEVPECELAREAAASIRKHLEGMGQEWVAAWDLAETKVYRPKKIPGTIRKAIQYRDENKCRYCGKKVDWSDHRGARGGTLDHVNPAGSSEQNNLVVACRKCNSFKGFRTPEQAGMVILGTIR
jgi:hypothetical protein